MTLGWQHQQIARSELIFSFLTKQGTKFHSLNCQTLLKRMWKGHIMFWYERFEIKSSHRLWFEWTENASLAVNNMGLKNETFWRLRQEPETCHFFFFQQLFKRTENSAGHFINSTYCMLNVVTFRYLTLYWVACLLKQNGKKLIFPYRVFF